MDMHTWIFYFTVALIAVLSPGPAILLSVTTSIAHGFSRSVYSSLGNITGLLMVSCAAAFGLGAIFQSSVKLFTILKVAGAVYLIYLGIRQWRCKANPFDGIENEARHRRRKSQIFFHGVLVAISNPKAVVFFTALFPQFIDISKPVPIQFFILTVTFMVLSFVALLSFALGAQAAKGWLTHGRWAVWYRRISGTVFIAFGVGMLRLRTKTA